MLLCLQDVAMIKVYMYFRHTCLYIHKYTCYKYVSKYTYIQNVAILMKMSQCLQNVAMIKVYMYFPHTCLYIHTHTCYSHFSKSSKC